MRSHGKRVSNRLAGQIGEHLVCAELGRRGYTATPFSGNVPTFDVLAADARGHTVPIQVKSSRGESWPSLATTWMNIHFDPATNRQIYSGPSELADPELIWVCVSIASNGDRDRFYVLTKADLQSVCVKGYTEWMDSLEWKRPRNPQSLDCRWDSEDIQEFENRWELITRQIEAIDLDVPPAANGAAERQEFNRVALAGRAREEHLSRLRVAELEKRDRRGYEAKPQGVEEYLPWQEIAAWPED